MPAYKSALGALLFDRKPKVPQYPTVDFGKELKLGAQEAIGAMPDIERLGSEYNRYALSEFQKLMEAQYPGYSRIMGEGTKNIESMVKGEIPEDVRAQIERTTAQRGVAAGISGSGLEGAGLTRSLGLTSLDISSRGLQGAQSWLVNRAPQFDPASMLVSPTFRIQAKLKENEMKFQRDWLANKIKAMPEGWEQAVQGYLDSWAQTNTDITEQWVRMYSSPGGGMGGGGGGGMGGGRMGGGGGGGGSTLDKASAAKAQQTPNSQQYLNMGFANEPQGNAWSLQTSAWNMSYETGGYGNSQAPANASNYNYSYPGYGQP